MKKALLPSLLLFAFSLTTTALHGQMSGTVSIDSTAAATNTNFKNWYSFWRSLQGLSRSDGGSTLTAGISGNLTVDVKSNSTEDSNVRFPAISGVSSSATITIKGNGKYVSYVGLGEVISFQGGDYFTIQGLIVRHRGTNASSATCIRFYNNSDNNKIESCTLEFSALTTGSTNGSAYIAFSASASNYNSVSATLTGSRNTISNNLMRTTNGSNPGPAYGISVIGSSSGYTTTSHNNTISNNTIQNFYFCALQNHYSNGNQFLNNNISRANSNSKNCNSFLIGYNCSNTYSTGRSTMYKGNNLHDLPYLNCPSSGGMNDLLCINAVNNHGSSSYPFLLDSNQFKNLIAYDNPGMGFIRDNFFIKITRNNIENLQSYNNVNEAIVWHVRACEDFVFSQNTFTKSYIAGWVSAYFFGDSLWSPNYKITDISWNKVIDNNFFAEALLLIPNEGAFSIHDNTIQKNYITGGNGGYLIAVGCQEFEDMEVQNNLITDNIGHDGFYGMYFTSKIDLKNTCTVRQNTIYSDGTKAPVGKGYENNSIWFAPYMHSSINFTGNIIYMMEASAGIMASLDCNDTAAVDLWDNNTFYSYNMGTEYWFLNGNQGYSFSDWKALGISGSSENYLDPKFADISNGDFHSLKWQTQNDVLTASSNPKDLSGVNRIKPRSDRGVYEQSSDLKAVKTSFSVASNICSGKTITNTDITVKNLFKDTAYNFYVAYSINGGTPVRQKVTKKILYNDSFNVVFSEPMQLNKWGKARIAIYIDASDDNAANDSFIFNTFVNPAPGGSKFSASSKPTKTIYKNGNPSDIIFPNEPWYYNVTAPRSYSNSMYGTHWTASVTAHTLKGTPVTGATLVTPSGGSDMEIGFKTSNLALQDSIIRVCLKVTDLNNGCDTSYCMTLYVNSVVIPDFNYTSLICGSDTAKFTNLSYVQKGGMYFHWNFGTGNAKDTSNEVDPWFVYSTPGTYKVKLTAFTNPYGYKTYDSATIIVQAKPNASFTRVNACEGQSVVFTNNSTPSGATYLWKFGNGAVSSQKDPVYKYNNPGQYPVTLYVTQNGCVDSAKLNAFTFPNPKANFTLPSGSICHNSEVSFTNTSTISSGTFASYWTFEPGYTSNVANPKHTFSSPGTKNVKLLLISGFGCKDSAIKSLTIKESPMVAFSHTEGCSIDSTVFTNLTPTVAGVVSNYSWSFGDGDKSTAQNPWHYWKTLGDKQVKLVVKLDNGCQDSLTKTVTVRVQPKVNFTDNSPVCAGSKVVFTNNTTWAKGQIGHEWDFGDNATSTLSDPEHTYSANTLTTYYATLCSDVDGYCKTCFTKPVTVNELPKTCDFEYAPDYAYAFYGAKFTPKDANGNVGAEAGITYNWTYNSNTITGSTSNIDFNADGTYSVQMCASTSKNCSCCTTKQVVMNRAGLHTPGVGEPKVYPNPNAGKFRIEMASGTYGNVEVVLYNTAGQLVYSTTSNASIIDVQAGTVAPGIYILEVTNNGVNYRSMLDIRN